MKVRTLLREQWVPAPLAEVFTFFAEAGDGGTLIIDKVRYAVPIGTLGDFCAGWLVRGDVERIFEYRAKQISPLFQMEHVG